jgi:hypothetical protein
MNHVKDLLMQAKQFIFHNNRLLPKFAPVTGDPPAVMKLDEEPLFVNHGKRF